MKKARFVAGAVCAECGAVDRVTLQIDEARNVALRHCVACGARSEAPLRTPSVPLGRRERPAKIADATESQAVKILDPSGPAADEPETPSS